MTREERGVTTLDTNLPWATIEVPEPDGALIAAVVQFADRAKEIVVADVASYSGAMGSLREVATLTKKLEDDRKGKKQPLLQATRELDGAYRPAEEALKGARAAIEQQAHRYEREEAQKREAAERKARMEAEKERARLEKLAEKAEARGDTDKAAEFESRAAYVPTPIVPSQVPKVEGVGKRTYWKFEVIDQSLLPPFYLIPYEAAIQKLVDSSHEEAAKLVSGAIRVWSEERSVVRGA